MDRHDRDLDVVLFGATGFTGRLVAEHLLAAHGARSDGGGLRWAMAGRSRDKLERLRAELGGETVPLLVADSQDAASLTRLARAARVVCTTVGPYARYGSRLVEVCACEGADCCDLTGEVPWMRRMIDAHQETAANSGARIVHACGFDSIPSDLGVLFLQEAARARWGVPASRVKGRVVRMRGAMSGGTAASMLLVLEEARRDKGVRRILADPYALDPPGSPRGPDRADQADQSAALWDPDFGRWTVPFVMASINTRVVRRSAALLGHPWGEGFRYDEAMLAPEGAGALRAKLGAFAMTAGTAALALPPLRWLAERFLPEPGEGPGPEERARGGFEILFRGAHPEDPERALVARVTGDRDPGYGATSRMLGEAAVCLAQDEPICGGGFWTPATAMGGSLIGRLRERAGMGFAIEEADAGRAGSG